jgi:UDP-N-acetylglucosamine diphosphorylase/glucosamine-1-phosphate N-acetyltransferase
MSLILFDDASWENLLPLSFTRPAADLRVGILTVAEKWADELGMPASYLTKEHLSGKFPCHSEEDNLLINGTLLPDNQVVAAITSLKEESALIKDGTLLAVRTDKEGADSFQTDSWSGHLTLYPHEVGLVDYPWKVFRLNGVEIVADLKRITRGRTGASLSNTVKVTAPENVFVEPGFKGEHFTLNASTGPVYLGPDSEIMEGSLIRGPFALCEESVVKMGAKIYGPTTIGPASKVGGEINNSVIQANSNKAHDGFLGNAVIGEWCNLGADTNNSNLKNNYSEVKIWNYSKKRFQKTGLQFCGLIMGDHSKCAINTMFNTGTVVGVAANIFGPGFPRNFVPSFSWGGAGGFSTYRMDKVLETIKLVQERRGIEFTAEDRNILQYIFDQTEGYRKWN